MNELSVHALLQKVEAIHGTRARFVERVHVVEAFRGDPPWQGDVLVFELLDHPRAPRCYAWEMDGESRPSCRTTSSTRLRKRFAPRSWAG